MSGRILQTHRPRLFSLLLSFLLLTLFFFSCHGDGHRRRTVQTVKNLTVGVPVPDAVSFNSFKDYSVSTIPDQLYKISVTGRTDTAVLTFYGTDASFNTPGQCAIDNTNLADTSAEDCIVFAPADVLYFSVDGVSLSSSSASYTIAVDALATTNLNQSIPSSDTITQTGAGVYSVPSSAGSHYTIGVTGLDNDVDLYVFDDACVPNNTLFTETTPEDCTVTAGGSSLFFVVDGIFSSSATVRYTAVATAAPVVPAPSNQGSALSPVLLSGNTPIVGQVASGPTGSSFYSVTGLNSGSRYTVSILGLTNDADLTVFGSDNTFTNPAACLIDNTFFIGTTPEACTVTVTGSTLYYSVTGIATSGGVAFINLTVPGP